MDLSLLNCVRKAFIGLAAIGLATYWSTGALAGSLSISGGVCPTLPEGGHGYCTDIILTNSSTATTLDGNGNPFLVLASGDSGIFTVGTSYNADKNGVTGCKQNLTLQAGQKCRIEVRYRPVYYRATPHWVRYNVISTGYAPQIYISGQSILAGTVTLSAPTCPTVTTLNQTVTCGNIMVTAQNAPVQFGGEYGTYSWVSGDSSQWVISTPTDSTRCNGNVMQPGQSCALATVSFRPKSYGTHSITYKTDLYAGTDQNVTVSGTANPPYTYSWSTGSWDTCSGGTGTWSYSAWSPASGCGSVTQTRTATCNPNAGTGSQSRSVTCLRSDGVTVADSFCTGTKPATTQSCTPTTGYSCGTQGSTSQTVTLTNSCTGTASLSSVSCGNTGVGTSKNCGTMTVTASGGPILLGSTLYTTSGTTSQFSLGAPSSNACSANQALTSGASCNLRTITHQPTNAGSASMTITVTPAGGNAGSGTVSGTGSYGSTVVNPTSLSCDDVGAGATVNCGTITVTASGGQVRLETPSLTLSNSTHFELSLGTCTAGKILNNGESCTTGDVVFRPQSVGAQSATITINTVTSTDSTVSVSGNGLAGTASVAPSTLNCGSTTAGESKSCGTVTITATLGPITFTGTPVSTSDNFSVTTGTCAPNTTLSLGQSCTTGAVMFIPTTAGEKSGTLTINCSTGACSRQVALTGTSYTYSWAPQPWGAWSSTCSENASRTRQVLCERSDGEFVPDELCDAGSRPTDNQTAEVLTGCSYTWVESGFGACQGGAGSWVTGEWGPTMACGTLEQTRTVICAFTADSGAHSQTVTCRRSDGATRPDEECDSGTRPPTVESCTPTDVAVCGERPSDTRTVTLDTSCTLEAVLAACERDDDNMFCVAAPL